MFIVIEVQGGSVMGVYSKQDRGDYGEQCVIIDRDAQKIGASGVIPIDIEPLPKELELEVTQ